jgi:hypothetical protein
MYTFQVKFVYSIHSWSGIRQFWSALQDIETPMTRAWTQRLMVMWQMAMRQNGEAADGAMEDRRLGFILCGTLFF